MSANKFTVKAVLAILEADLGITACTRANVVKLLGQDPESSCGEQEAARILEISDTTLYNWRKGKWVRQPHDFFFKCWFTPANEVRYDKSQLIAYAELRRILSTRKIEQPVITEDALKQYSKIKEDRA